MTVPGRPAAPAKSEVIVREYAEADYGACRSLWVQLTEYHRSIYGDPSIVRTLGGHVDLTMDLAARRHEWLTGASLHGLDFDY